MKIPTFYGLIALSNYFTPNLNEKAKEGQVTSLPIPSFLGSNNPFDIVGNLVEDQPAQALSWTGSAGNHPATPDQDAFYAPPLQTYANLTNGDIIAIRPVGYGPADLVQVSQAFQLSYRTESTSGEPRADVTTVLVPTNYDGQTLVSLQLYEDANALKCSPSYQMLQGAFDPFLFLVLDQGWMLNIPDHEGYYSAFTAGIKEGKSTLDSLRAVANARSQLGVHYDKVGMYGYSGGSIATAHALELHQSYAPDVNITLAGIGGVIANLTGSMVHTAGGVFAGFSFGGILGMATEYPELHDAIYNNLKPEVRDDLLAASQHCSAWDLLHYFGKNLSDYFEGGDSVFSSPAVMAILDSEEMGKTAPQVPLFVHHGINDEIANVTYTDDLVDFYCQGGTRVMYHRDPGMGHVEEELLGIPQVIRFFQAGFNGFQNIAMPTCSSYEDAASHDMNSSQYYDFGHLWDAIMENYTPWGLQQV